MKHKILLLTTLFTIGLTTQYCGMNCKCDPVVFPYFDIHDIELLHNFVNTETSSLEEGVWFSDYNGLILYYDYDVIAATQNSKNCKQSFSLMNTAYGCSCDYDGSQGSKEEQLENLVITTVNDFDSLHLANDTINDLFTVRRSIYGSHLTLEEYLKLDTLNILSNKMELLLTEPPVLNQKFQAKITVELSTGEIYEAKTDELELKF